MESIFGSSAITLERILDELQIMRPLIPTYAHLIVSAVFPIYAAAHASLARPLSAGPAVKKEDDAEASEHDEIEETSPKIETLTPSDAILFPVLAGCTLASLYFLLKFFKDPAWLNWFLGIYFAGIGFFFMMRFLQDTFSILRSFLLPRQYSYKGKVWRANEKESHYTSTSASGPPGRRESPLPGLFGSLRLPAAVRIRIWNLRRILYTKARLEFSVRNLIQIKLPVEALDVVSIALTCLVVLYHTFIGKPWYLTNLLGFSFCYGSLQFMTPGTSWTGTLLLSALFFYDIYFVFFTPMMVTVATKLDVPIKLLFPKPDGCVFPVGATEGSEAMEDYLRCLAKKRTMAMLGLGDIVVPGMMLAFALRFDLYLFYLRKKPQSSNANHQTYEKEQQTITKVEKDKNKSQKPAYTPATGFWGERFWVSSKFHQHLYPGKNFPKPYFYATVVGYISGMLTTVIVMQVSNHAQPALLYLVPGVLISLWATALFKGDLKLLWKYSEIPGDDEDEVEDKETGKKEIQAGDDGEDGSRGIENGDVESSTASKEAKTVDEDKEEVSRKDGPEKQATKAKQEDSLGPKNNLVYFAIVLPDTKVTTTAAISLGDGNSVEAKDDMAESQ